MCNDLVLKDIHISSDSPECFTVATPKLTITYTFHREKGLVLESFQNNAGDVGKEYLSAPCGITPFETGESNWNYLSGRTFTAAYGGRETAQLEMTVKCMRDQVTLHVIAFPGTSVIRQYFTVSNISLAHASTYTFIPFRLDISLDSNFDIFRLEWIHGGEASHEHGSLHSRVLSRSFHASSVCFSANATDKNLPLAMFVRENAPREGLMAALEYLGPWKFSAVRSSAMEKDCGSVSMRFQIDENRPLKVHPMESIDTPMVTLACYAGERDNLMKELYDWQYTYLWDYTNRDYFGKIRGTGANWIYCSRNLHEQFTYRLAVMNLLGAGRCKRIGYEVIWEDAGWLAYPGEWPPDDYGTVFLNNYEGPDYRLSQRYFKRCGLKWLLWFAGKPSIGILENKQGAWGAFEWRTDALGNEDLADDLSFRKQLEGFLGEDSRRSFHTCSGGSNYSHTFDVNRYSTYNYIADLGAGPYNNYYFSYFEAPDKWGDLIPNFGSKRICEDGSSFYAPELLLPEELTYIPEIARAHLTMVPLPCSPDVESSFAPCRRDLSIYHYLMNQGVAGCGSYMYHPKVYGDKEYYYMQRVSCDQKRALLILRHTPEGQVVIFPRGLLDEENYSVTFQNKDERFTASGKSLMEEGIILKEHTDGELIYFNLDDHPGAFNIHKTPSAPARVFVRPETNIGVSAAAVYWSPLPDEDAVEYYEVYRNDTRIAEVAVGCYWFDYTDPEENAVYQVRAVNIFGIASAFTAATAISGDKAKYEALGVHGENMARFGWTAEYSKDLKTFIPMHWVAPENPPYADLIGTPNQSGGCEGYWEGGDCARIGRGWMQASPTVYCCRTLVFDKAGSVRISGRAMREWYHKNAGGDVAVSVRLANKELLPFTSVPAGDLYGTAHDICTDVKKGDCLRFILSTSSPESAVMGFEREACLIGWLPVVEYHSEEKETSPVNLSLRINCGGDTDVYLGRALWSADSWRMKGSPLLIQENDGLMSCVAAGETVEYLIPVSTGLYTLRLRFAEPEYRYSGERMFDVQINGKTVDQALDIIRESRERGKVYDRIYNNVLPNADGNIQITLIAQKGEAVIAGIELADERRDHVRINCGSSVPFIDWAGGVWEADNAPAEECILSENSVLQSSPTLYDQKLYQCGRIARDITYTLPLSDGLYSVHLKFAELWKTAATAGCKRTMNIFVNDILMKQDFDPAEAAGWLNMAADVRLDDISPIDGVMTIRVQATGELPALLQAVECE